MEPRDGKFQSLNSSERGCLGLFFQHPFSNGPVPMMDSHNDGSMLPRAAQACISCRKQKRKCDKSLPVCSLCVRMGRSCDYSDNAPAPNAGEFAALRQKVIDLEARLDEKASGDAKTGFFTPESLSPSTSTPARPNGRTRSTFPAVFFLDTDIFQEVRPTIPRPVVQIPPGVQAALGDLSDIHSITHTFFSTIQLWLPIVSKKRLRLTLSNPNLEPGADLALLLLSMKLISQPVSDGSFSAQTSLYWTTKSYYSLLESSAMLSIQLLQSLVLIAVYEIGHGIYPAAYLTAGQCSRLGYAFGLHRRKDSLQMLKRVGSWAESEEIGRVWWAVMLLDRYVNVGGGGRPLAIEDPNRAQILPSDDFLWDEGEITSSEPLYITSPTSIKAGAFARTCQATHLLGRLVRLLTDRHTDNQMYFCEAIQIHRTISALVNLLPSEVEQSPFQFATSMALCYTALLTIGERFACADMSIDDHTVEETEMQTIAIQCLKGISAAVLQLSHLLRQGMAVNMAATSPFTADCLYQAAAQFAWLVHETGTPEMVQSYHSIVETLVLMKSRWAVAGEYLESLEMGKQALYSDNPLL